ncbi:MAG: GNAT family N-acetyltransferase [Pseudomonadota bacterium]|nr:GNAT family N-acetyltransferase [Pseudomonadota bacterium]
MNSPSSLTAIQGSHDPQSWLIQQPSLGTVEIAVEHRNQQVHLTLDANDLTLVLALTGEQQLIPGDWHLATAKRGREQQALALLLALDVVFSLRPSGSAISADADLSALLPDTLVAAGVIERQAFYQWPALWLSKGVAYPSPASWQTTDGTCHPRRPAQPWGEFYRRFVPSLGRTLSFRALDPEQDLDLFYRWMNEPRIAAAWELDHPKAQLHQYLLERVGASHIHAALGLYDDEPFGYFELYWTAEDRLGPYYDAGDFDRGLHILVGNPAYLGTRWFNGWLTGLTHYLLLDDPRTQRVMGEPRADNQNLLKHLQTVPAWHKLREFDFPHKRAALLECTRQRFFSQIQMP